jgi:hypothetical protein
MSRKIIQSSDMRLPFRRSEAWQETDREHTASEALAPTTRRWNASTNGQDSPKSGRRGVLRERRDNPTPFPGLR